MSTILVNAVFAPVLEWLAGFQSPMPDIFNMLQTALLGCASYIVICTVF